MNILVVEDDQGIAMGLEYSLKQEGYTPLICHDIREAQAILREDFGMALLDLTLPDGNGYDLCQQIKAQKDIPVIFLTACDSEVNVVMGLDMGADDYITKPFRIRELFSRLRTVLRRYDRGAQLAGHYLIGNVRLDPHEAKVYKNNQEVLLSALEYRLLLTFFNNRNQVLSRTQLLENIWDAAGNFVNDNTVTVYIKRLREKLEDDPQNPTLIKTVRGLGYKVGD